MSVGLISLSRLAEIDVDISWSGRLISFVSRSMSSVCFHWRHTPAWRRDPCLQLYVQFQNEFQSILISNCSFSVLLCNFRRINSTQFYVKADGYRTMRWWIREARGEVIDAERKKINGFTGPRLTVRYARTHTQDGEEQDRIRVLGRSAILCPSRQDFKEVCGCNNTDSWHLHPSFCLIALVRSLSFLIYHLDFQYNEENND